MTSTTKNILIVVGVIVLLVAGLYLYSEYFAPVSGGSDVTTQDANVNFPGMAISQELANIESLNLQAGTGLFTDPGYQSLHDSSVVLGTEPAGRSNPFAPVSGSVSASKSKK